MAWNTLVHDVPRAQIDARVTIQKSANAKRLALAHFLLRLVYSV